MNDKKHILFGVLNWGLGHATRSVPIIQALKSRGFEPVIASDGVALDYLKAEFPNLNFEELKPYGIKYDGKNLIWKIAQQLPKVKIAIDSERRSLKSLISKYNVVGVVSDNRLGFYTSKVPCAYLTHQINILAPFPFSAASKLHQRYIKKFDQCWVPDFENAPNLSGSMGHAKKLISRTKFIGPLSRFSESVQSLPKEFDLMIILSGPEPQRSILEEKVLKQLKERKGKHLLVRGSQSSLKLSPSSNIKVLDMAFSKDIPKLIGQSKMVLSRSGYSSLMDYYVLKNKALLIPTPGQVEQEYLATKLMKEGVFYAVSQDDLDIETDLTRAMDYPGFTKLNRSNMILEWDILFSLFQGE